MEYREQVMQHKADIHMTLRAVESSTYIVGIACLGVGREDLQGLS